MDNPAGFDGMAKGLRDMFLFDNFRECLGPIFTGKNQIRHNDELAKGQYVGMAEREGFEPSAPLLTAHTISSRAPSAARTSLQNQTGGLIFRPKSLAERVGFEPTIPFLTGYRFSRAGPSAARPPLHLLPSDLICVNILSDNFCQ